MRARFGRVLKPQAYGSGLLKIGSSTRRSWNAVLASRWGDIGRVLSVRVPAQGQARPVPSGSVFNIIDDINVPRGWIARYVAEATERHVLRTSSRIPWCGR
jgi:hypothetical protein